MEKITQIGKSSWIYVEIDGKFIGSFISLDYYKQWKLNNI